MAVVAGSPGLEGADMAQNPFAALRAPSSDMQFLLDSLQKARDSMWTAVSPPQIPQTIQQPPPSPNMLTAQGQQSMMPPGVYILQPLPQPAAQPPISEMPAEPSSPSRPPKKVIPPETDSASDVTAHFGNGSQREFQQKLHRLRGHLPELRARRSELDGALTSLDAQISEVHQRCLEARRDGQAEFEALKAHLSSVESLKLAVLGREREERARLAESIEHVLKRVDSAASGGTSREIASDFLRDFPDLHAQAQSLWSRSAALPQVEVGLDDIPFEARAKTDRLRKFAVMGRLQFAKDACLWNLEQQRRQLAMEAAEAGACLEHLEALLDRYSEELAFSCYFCSERFSASSANTCCMYNQASRAGMSLSADPRVPPHAWGAGTHFWVPHPHVTARGRSSSSTAGLGARMRKGTDDHIDAFSGPPSRHSTPPRGIPSSDVLLHAAEVGWGHYPGVSPWPDAGNFRRHVADSPWPEPALPGRYGRQPQPDPMFLGGGSGPPTPWSSGFAFPGHLLTPSSDALLSKIAQACDRSGVHIRDAFKAFDANGDGFISPQEFKHALAQLRIGASEEEMEWLVSRMDTNQDGMVSYEEFLMTHFHAVQDPRVANVGPAVVEHFSGHDAAAQSLWQRVARVFKERRVPLRQAFALFDTDGDGVISRQDLLQAFRLMRLGLSESDVERMMRDIDANENGKVSIHEFINRLT